jgi:hypothetical protein
MLTADWTGVSRIVSCGRDVNSVCIYGCTQRGFTSSDAAQFHGGQPRDARHFGGDLRRRGKQEPEIVYSSRRLRRGWHAISQRGQHSRHYVRFEISLLAAHFKALG